jgi:hypothetical protein
MDEIGYQLSVTNSCLSCLGVGLGGAALALGAHRVVFCT